jgi:hypothetical protein
MTTDEFATDAVRGPIVRVDAVAGSDDLAAGV